MKQTALFAGPPALVPGFEYRPEFVTEAEEARLLAVIGALPLAPARYRQYTAKRRIVSYGGSYDFAKHKLEAAQPVPEFLDELRARIAAWTETPAEDFRHATIIEYERGTQLGWHRDVPDFEVIAGVSLAGSCRMRLRPYPPKNVRRDEILALELTPRSAYVMKGDVRWKWQHSIPPTPALRYSITFRTLARSHRRRP